MFTVDVKQQSNKQNYESRPSPLLLQVSYIFAIDESETGPKVNVNPLARLG